jgi:hypothetical protein
MPVESGQQVGRRRAARSPLPPTGDRWGRVDRLPIGQQSLIADPEPGPRLLVDPVSAGGADPLGD